MFHLPRQGPYSFKASWTFNLGWFCNPIFTESKKEKKNTLSYVLDQWVCLASSPLPLRKDCEHAHLQHPCIHASHPNTVIMPADASPEIKMSVCNLRQVPRCNLPVKGLLLFSPNRWVLTLIRHLLGAAAEAHLCHGGTKPVISANIAVKGAAGLLSAQECSLAARLVTPVPSLSFLFCFLFPRRLGSRRHPAVSATVAAQSSIRPLLRHHSSRLVLVLNSYRFDFSRRHHNCQHCYTSPRQLGRQNN